MMKQLIRICLIVLAFTFTLNAFAQSTPIARVVWANGSFTANGRALQKNGMIYQNDTLQTGNKSQAQIVFSDNGLMTLKENSTFSVNSYAFNKKTSSGNFAGNLVAGGFRTITGLIGKKNPAAYEINTPIATLGVRGTDYQAVINNGALYVQVYKGRVCMNNGAGTASTPPPTNWLFNPAVYQPQVLTVTDEHVDVPRLNTPTTPCPDGGAPVFTTTIGDQRVLGGIGSVDVSPNFSGNNLVFTLASITPALSGTNFVTVSPSGIVDFDGSNPNAFYNITVAATNACGTVISNVFPVGASII